MLSRISRRNFLTSTATAAGALALGCRDSWIAAPPPAQLGRAALVDPGASGIDHVIVFMMENRSFDHFLGWLPGADGRQAGLTYSDAAGASYSTFPLAPDFQGCGYQDPDHSYRWVGLHMVVGSGMVLSLFLLALVAVRSHARPGLVVL